MAGIYIHIPFCKQACHYCDFHFSTSLKKKAALVNALCKELILKKEGQSVIETVYFGGGTPSLLTAEEFQKILKTVQKSYHVAHNAEITVEANPDDITEEKLKAWQASGVNRLSIGVQSFFEEDLTLMNRAHNANEALQSIELAQRYFDNISIDLIYGIPGLTHERWQQNLQQTLALEIPHISSYALTVEPYTALKTFIEKGKIKPVDEAMARQQYEMLVYTLEKAGYTNYEFSNFGQPGYFSQNNTAYWLGKPYVGIGPSAHGFDGVSRNWNLRNNATYLKALQRNEIPSETEKLSLTDRYNEYVMTRLRTMWGISLKEINEKFGKKYKAYLQKEAHVFFEKGLLTRKEGIITIAKKGKFLSDGIAADLFFVD